MLIYQRVPSSVVKRGLAWRVNQREIQDPIDGGT